MKNISLSIAPLKSALMSVAIAAALAPAAVFAQTGSIVGAPAAKIYLPYGASVPAMSYKDLSGNVIDYRTDKNRVRHFWKTFNHRLTPTPFAQIPDYGWVNVSTFWNITSNWTGNVDSCNAGTISSGAQEAAIRQVNWYRSMAGLNPVKNGASDRQALAQKGALINVANQLRGLDHVPPTNAKCFSAEAQTGAGISNLASFGANAKGTTGRGPGSIDGFMDDGGEANYPVGHRRYHLHPQAVSMSYGEVIGQSIAPSPGLDLYGIGASALQINQFGNAPEPDVVAWPSPGYLPYQAYPLSNRWSVSCTGCDFSGATVAMKRNGVSVGTRIEANKEFFADQQALVWEAQGISYGQYEPRGTAVFSQEDTFDVTITYRQNGIQKTKSYKTIVFNPESGEDFVPPYDLNDHYWVPSESGWGVIFTQATDGNLFGAVYFYDEQGNQRWMTMQGAWTAKNVFSGKLYTTKGNPFNAVPFNPASIVVTEAGQGSLTFSPDTQSVRFDFNVGGQASSKQMVRFDNIPAGFGNGSNYRGMWWDPRESGWGLTVQHYYNTLFISWFTYDFNGNQLWLTFQGNWTNETTFEGKLYTTRQAPWNGQVFDPAATQVQEVGTGKMSFGDYNKATFDYTLKGVAGHKDLVKFEF